MTIHCPACAADLEVGPALLRTDPYQFVVKRLRAGPCDRPCVDGKALTGTDRLRSASALEGARVEKENEARTEANSA